MDRNWFGEGLTRLGNKLYQITWLSNKGFIYGIPNLQQVRFLDWRLLRDDAGSKHS